MATGDILIRWVSESSAAVRDMAKVEGALKDTMTSGEKWSRRWATASDMALKAGTAMAGVIAAEAVRAGKAAAVQEQAVGGLNAVFKDQGEAMRQWARGMSDYGLAMTDTAQFAARLGSSLKGAGMDLDTAAEQTQRLVELGADLAATYGGTTADAVTALGAALRGEYDPLEAFGAALSASQVEAVLAAEGQDKLTGAARQQAEMAARLSLIWDKTKDAQGQAAREADTSAAAYERFMAKLKNAEADLGTALLPVMEDVAGAMSEIADAAEEDPEAVREWAQAFVALAGGLIVLGSASKAVVVLQGISTAIKGLPKAGPFGGLGLIAAGMAALKQIQAPDQGWITWLKEFGNLDVGDNLREWVAPLQAAQEWLSGLFTTIRQNVGWIAQLGIRLATVTDALGITEGAADRLRASLAEPFTAEIDAANAKALNAAARAENALRRVAGGRYRATIDAAEDKARAAARDAQRAIDAVQQGRPARIDGDGSPARTEAARTKAYIDGLGATLNIRARVIGLQAALAAAAPVTGSRADTRQAAAAPETLRIDRLVIEMKETPADPMRFAWQVRDALASDEIRTGRTRVAR